MSVLSSAWQWHREASSPHHTLFILSKYPFLSAYIVVFYSILMFPMFFASSYPTLCLHLSLYLQRVSSSWTHGRVTSPLSKIISRTQWKNLFSLNVSQKRWRSFSQAKAETLNTIKSGVCSGVLHFRATIYYPHGHSSSAAGSMEVPS